MTLYSILRFEIILLALVIGCSATQATDPLKKLPEYWIPNFDKEVSTDARQARFVGYLEGSLNVNIPQWWRNEGLSEGPNIKSTENASIYGEHPKDSLEVNGDVFTVEDKSPPSNRFNVYRKSKGKDIWNITEDIVVYSGGYGGSGSRDYAIRASGDTVFIFAREVNIRFIVAYSATNGSRLGFFAYNADSIGDIKLH